MRGWNKGWNVGGMFGSAVGRQIVAKLVLAATLVSLLLGCATSDYMLETPDKPIATSPDQATVVFIRATSFGGAIKFMIIDQDGRFIGESTANSHFEVLLPPGEYLFIAEAENTDVLKAQLAAGRTYYVEVSPKMGLFKAQVALHPVKKGSENWEELPEWLEETDHWIPIVAKGQAALDEDKDEILERVQEGKDEWQEYSAEERAESLLAIEDGQVGDHPSAQEPAQPEVQTAEAPPVETAPAEPAAGPEPPAIPVEPGS